MLVDQVQQALAPRRIETQPIGDGPEGDVAPAQAGVLQKGAQVVGRLGALPVADPGQARVQRLEQAEAEDGVQAGGGGIVKGFSTRALSRLRRSTFLFRFNSLVSHRIPRQGHLEIFLRCPSASSAYATREIGDHFGLHYSRVSKIVRAAETPGKKEIGKT